MYILMLNYVIFTNFVFCRFSLKKKIILAENKKKNGKYSILFQHIVFMCRDRISSKPEELSHSQKLYVATKSMLNSRQK